MTIASPRVLLHALILVAAPLAAQTEERLDLELGTPVQVQMRSDTSWREADIVMVGTCRMVALAGARSDTGFAASSFAGVTALRVIDASRRWHLLGGAQLAELRGCSAPGGGAAPTDQACGADPERARAGVAGFLYGMNARGPTGTPWDNYLGYGRNDLIPEREGAACQRILAALSAARASQPADTLPLVGILRMGDQGFVVYRATSMDGAHGRPEMSQALLGARLELLAYRRFSF